MDIFSKLKRGLRNPAKIPSYIRTRLASSLHLKAMGVETWRQTFFLQPQLSELNTFRSQSEFLLVILDACRFDIFKELFPEYFEGDLKAVQSVGYDTFQYAQRAWGNDHEVTYISGATPINSKNAGYANEDLERLYQGYTPSDHISNIVDAWAYGWDTSIGTCPPEAVTEMALKNQSDKMVVHYFQPHAPYIGDESEYGYTETKDARPFDGKPPDSLIWERVQNGDICDERLRELYTSNLDRVLPEVCYLIEQLDFENVVVTSDHGEALGEFGMYAHHRYPHPYVRTVPWATIDGVVLESSEDRRTAQLHDRERGELLERLKGLGYIE